MKHKKSLGQNFFNNPNLANKIVDLVIDRDFSEIIEIGPGNGYFTEILVNKVGQEKRITIVEKDNDLANSLKVRYPKIKVINEDFLDLDLSKIIQKDTVVFGSLPYNVSKPIILKCIQNTSIVDMFFIVQKEVAQKYSISSPSSALYVLTKIYVDTKIILDISPGSFIPQPKVMSSLIHMHPNSNYKDVDIKKFNQMVKNSFVKPRKTLKNNLRSLNIDITRFENKRPQELSFEDYVSLIK